MKNAAKLCAALLLLPPGVQAGGIPGAPPEVVVNIVGGTVAVSAAESASQGYISAEQLENRPRLRNGEILEAVPGLIVTQHSGDGKANQYFLRGLEPVHDFFIPASESHFVQCQEADALLGDSKRVSADTAMCKMAPDPSGCRLKSRHPLLRTAGLESPSGAARA